MLPDPTAALAAHARLSSLSRRYVSGVLTPDRGETKAPPPKAHRTAMKCQVCGTTDEAEFRHKARSLCYPCKNELVKARHAAMRRAKGVPVRNFKEAR